MQIEAERKKKQPPSEMEVVRRKETNAMLSSANKMREENMDEVKAMNQMMLAAKCVQIRDAQIHEICDPVEQNECRSRKQMPLSSSRSAWLRRRTSSKK